MGPDLRSSGTAPIPFCASFDVRIEALLEDPARLKGGFDDVFYHGENAVSVSPLLERQAIRSRRIYVPKIWMFADIMSIWRPLRLIAACCFCLRASCSSARWTDEAAGAGREEEAVEVDAWRIAPKMTKAGSRCRAGTSSDIAGILNSSVKVVNYHQTYRLDDRHFDFSPLIH